MTEGNENKLLGQDAYSLLKVKKYIDDLNEIIQSAEQHGWTDAKRGTLKRYCVFLMHHDVFGIASECVKRTKI